MTITIGNSQGIPMGKYTPSTGGGGGGGADLTSYYTKTETDGLLDEKQDVLTPTSPINIGTTTIGEPNNISVLNGVITPAVVGSDKDVNLIYNPNDDTYELYMEFEGTANTSNFNDLFAGKSYFDIPINFSNYFTDDYSSDQNITVRINDLGTVNLNNSFTFFAGQLTGEGFKPYIVSQVYTLSTSASPTGGTAIADGVVKPTWRPSSSSSIRTVYGVPVGAYTATSRNSTTGANTVKQAYLSITKEIAGGLSAIGYWRIGSNVYYRATASLGLGAWQLSDLQSCNVIRVVMNWASSSYATSAYLPTSENVYVHVNNERLPWNIESGIVKTYGISLKYDNQTIQVNSEGELVANLDELGNEVNAISGRVTALENNDPKASIINEVTSGVIGKAYNSNEDEIVITEPITNRAYLYAPYQAKAFSQNDAIEVTGRTTITSAETVAMPLVVQVISDSKMYLNHSIRTLMNNGVITFGLSVSNYTPATTVTVQVGDVIDFKYIYDPSNSLCELLYDINGSGEFISLGRVAAETTGRDTTLTDRSLLEIWVDGASTIPADYTVKINGNLVFSGNWVEPFIDNKANTDLSNLNSEGKNYIATAVKPSGQYEDLTLLASGSSYTAPGTGYVNLWRICNGSGSYAGLYGAFPSIYSGDANEEFSIFLPVLQGQTFYVFYSDLKTDQPNDAFKFYYDIGASNL